MLLIAQFDPNGLLTIVQTIQEMIIKSEFSIDLLNIYYEVPYLTTKELNQYKGIILHNTATYTTISLELVNTLILKRYSGLKIIMKQDEHYHTNYFTTFLKENNIDLLLSIWDEKTAKEVYLKNNSHLSIIQYLTGYVPDEYKHMRCDLNNRNIDVGYRGSLQPLIFGQLAYEKHQIGDEFKKFARQYNLRYDISSRWEDRFMGNEWLVFLRNCKCVLGVESGSDIVDFDGKLEKNYKHYIKKNPKASEMEIVDFIKQFNSGIQYRAISPRHIEASACKTLQIMYEGDFQGIFLPYRHYVPLKRDYSNIEEVIGYVIDDRKRKEVVECAFEEIVMNDAYSFDKFVEKFDLAVSKLLN